MPVAKTVQRFSKSSKPTKSARQRKPTRVKLLGQSNSGSLRLGRISITVARTNDGQWRFAVEDEGGPMDTLTDLAAAMNYVKQSIEGAAKRVTDYESLRWVFDL